MKAIVILSIFILSFLSASVTFQTVRAEQVGTVCIAQVNPTNCPPTSPVFSGTPGTNLTVAVNIQYSNSTNGFDVSVKTDPSILNPVSIDYSGTVEPQPLFIALECINGHLIAGNQCGSTDGPGIARLALVSLGKSTIPPTTGHLFSITFNIVQATATTIGYQTGCTSSSVSGTTTCVTITNGTSSPVPVTVVDPEFIQTAGFNLIPVNQTIQFDGLTITVNGSITVDTSTKTVTGKITLTALDSTGVVVFSKTFTFSFVYSNSQNVKFGVAFPSISSMLASTCSLNTATSGVSCTSSKNPDLQNQGKVDIADLSTIALAWRSIPGSPNWNPAADLNGDGQVNIQDLAICAFDFGMPVYY